MGLVSRLDGDRSPLADLSRFLDHNHSSKGLNVAELLQMRPSSPRRSSNSGQMSGQ